MGEGNHAGSQPRRQRDRLRDGPTLSRLLLSITGLILSWLLFEKLDPFGMSKAASRQAAAAIERVAAPFYRTKVQDAIRVYTIDKNTIDVLTHSAWPPAYEFYVTTINTVAEAGAKALFLDLIITKRDQDTAGWIELVAAAKAATEQRGLQIFIASADCDDVGPVGLAWHVGALMVTFDATKGYPVRHCPDKRMFAAARLYALLVCDAQDDRPTPTECGKADGAGIVATMPMNMSVYWGSRQPDWLRQVGAAAKGLWRSMLQGLDPEVLHEAYDRDPEPLVFRSAPLTELAADATATSECRGAPASGLCGKIIMVGLDYDPANDFVTSAVFGRVPGVWLHAQALHNMLAYGADLSPGSEEDAETAAAALLLLSVSLFMVISTAAGWRPIGRLTATLASLPARLGERAHLPGMVDWAQRPAALPQIRQVAHLMSALIVLSMLFLALLTIGLIIWRASGITVASWASIALLCVPFFEVLEGKEAHPEP